MPTILNGKQFLICDERGDMRHGAEGMFARDARHLSRWVLRVDGRRPQPLGKPHGSHHLITFIQRNVSGARLGHDSVIVDRRMVVDDALYQRIAIENIAGAALAFDLSIEARADFHDVFQVKQDEYRKLGEDTGGVGLTGAREHEESPFVMRDDVACCAESGQSTRIAATMPFEIDSDGRLHWQLQLDACAHWVCDLRVSWDRTVDREPVRFDRHRMRIERDHAQWLSQTPAVVAGPSSLRRVYRTSIEDLAALRIHPDRVLDEDPDDDVAAVTGMLPAAGLPWFMTTFGRDTIITCLQCMMLGPERVRGAIAYLSLLQAVEDDPSVDAEPGKILHEVREGDIAERGYDVYYGSHDATPLYLVLLDSYYRWTGDDAFVRRWRSHAMAALEWIERHGDLDGDGFLEYTRRSTQGLENQSWKDSIDSQRFHDGHQAIGPIAPAEVQGYAYQARLCLARLSRSVFGDVALAIRLERDAAQLKQRFDDAFWVPASEVDAIGPDDPRRDGFHAMGLDGTKQRIDSLTSNIGHLLWSGIVDGRRVDAVVRQLHSRHLFNGYGVRTMSTLDAAHNPISYHNGTVWPHDTSICVAGLMGAGAHEIAAEIAGALLEASEAFDTRLPEVFAGLDRASTGYPIRYPTTCVPQAWAAAAPVFMMTRILGVVPDLETRSLIVHQATAPAWMEGLEWRGIRAFDRSWVIHVRDGVPVIEHS